MTEFLQILQAKVGEKPVYRRHHQKRDGRDLYLYGYEPHKLSPLPEADDDIAKGGELRFHPLRDEWNVYAAHRQNRTFKPVKANDPLAPSKIDGPPTEIPFADFELAVFENKFASLHRDAPVPVSRADIEMAKATGKCEVVVYGPDASGNLSTIGQDKRRLLCAAWNDRYEALFQDGNKFVLPFENRGDEVGVTLHHPHGQIYAFPFIPKVQARAAKAFADGYDLVAAIKSAGSIYEVATADNLLAYCPPYARFPYEVWIAPRERKAGPWEFNETQMNAFAHLLGDVTRRYDAFFQRPTAYMLSLQASPAGHEDSYHFTAQFYPLLRAPDRIKYLASVEQSTGVFTVDIMPETAAKTLRDI